MKPAGRNPGELVQYQKTRAAASSFAQRRRTGTNGTATHTWPTAVVRLSRENPTAQPANEHQRQMFSRDQRKSRAAPGEEVMAASGLGMHLVRNRHTWPPCPEEGVGVAAAFGAATAFRTRFLAAGGAFTFDLVLVFAPARPLALGLAFGLLVFFADRFLRAGDVPLEPIRKSSRLAPFLIFSAIHLGIAPRPAHTFDGFSVSRYFGGSVPPRLVPVAAFRPEERRPSISSR
jgi:hypothetical protein